MNQRALCYHPVGETFMLQRAGASRSFVNLRRKLAMLGRGERTGKGS
jgi:hypothetical protein